MTDIWRSVAGALGGLLFLAALLGGVYFTGRADERMEWVAKAAQAARDASEAARRVERERFRSREIVEVNHAAELDRARRGAAAVRGELGRLRDELARRDRAARDAGAAAGTDAAAAERELLGACAAEYQDLAGNADELAARLRGLQGYVTDVVRP